MMTQITYDPNYSCRICDALLEKPHSKTCAQASQELADAYEALKVDPTPAAAKEVAYLAVHWANVHATGCEE